MKKMTLCFLMYGDHVCLAMKKRGFGVGKWNGVGGKLESGESIRQAAVREIQEEIGVDVEHKHLERVGDMKFIYDCKPEWDQHVHIYLIRKWGGEPAESEEMAPKWHHRDEIPYKEMWVDDEIWLPKILAGEKIRGKFYFTEDGSEVLKFNISEYR